MPSEATSNTKQTAPRSVRCFVVTVSDTRTEETDTSGRAIADLLTAAGHSVVGRTIVQDDPALVRSTIERQLAHSDGAGRSSRPAAPASRRATARIEAVDALLEKRLDGFGELFRMLSFQQIGAAAMMSRATAGLAAGKIVVALPGSEAAVRLAMEKLLLPELGHLVQQAMRSKSRSGLQDLDYGFDDWHRTDDRSRPPSRSTKRADV